jgi:hypothetical protein
MARSSRAKKRSTILLSSTLSPPLLWIKGLHPYTQIFERKGYTFFELFGDFLILFEKRPLLSLEAVVESVF